MQLNVGVVVIGRNEGERLKKCLESLRGITQRVVYVDSGSTDGSVGTAGTMGVAVVQLDPRVPFSAALARNQGFKHLREVVSDLAHVQFVDGDCELHGAWLEKAAAFLDEHQGVAVVCGRLREKHPEKSIYNMLCDIEWDTPVGEAKACGGIAMMRTRAFEAVEGFRIDVVAGEEPELCVRLRGAGWRIRRLDEEMALHDAAIERFGQWWRRTLRGGYSFALGVALHGAAPERHRVRESRSAWFWGLGVPVAIAALALLWRAWALLLLLVYLLQVARLALRGGRSARENWWRAAFLVLGKFPEMLGQVKFLLERRAAGPARPIEYK